MIPQSQCTYPVFEIPISPEQFQVVILALAMHNQVDGESSQESLAWLLSYWRADHLHMDKDELAEMFYAGRSGYTEESLEELMSLCMSWLAWPLTSEHEVRPGKVNDLVRWAWHNHIPWPEENTDAR